MSTKTLLLGFILSLLASGAAISSDDLIRQGNFLGARHDLETCTCKRCKGIRQNQRWRVDPDWRGCTNLLYQLHTAERALTLDVQQLRRSIQLKADAHLVSTNEQAKVTIASNTLAKVQERIKEYNAKKGLIEIDYAKKQPSPTVSRDRFRYSPP